MKRLLAVAAVVVLTACTSGGDGSTDSEPAARLTTSSRSTTGPARSSESGLFARIPEIVERVQPSVVTVLTDVGQGSGVVFDEDGTVVTNNHVIAGASRVQIAFADGEQAPARVYATDAVVDLAVLKMEQPKRAPRAEFATALPRVGELAIALGDPLGFANSVTVGVISGLHRSIPGSAAQSASLVDLIQTDAPISPGNSGGALVGADGTVLGINVAYLPPETGSVSIGFAIPAQTVTSTVDELLDSGRARHAFIGIRPATLTPGMAQQFGLDVSEGVLVLSVEPGGPAASAQLEPGDVLTAIEGQALRTAEDLLVALRSRDPGDTVTLTVHRDATAFDVQFQLSDRPR
jgi:S1-C subfamily serine protease